MPSDAVIVVTIVVIAFSALMGTLGWATWYTRSLHRD